MAQTYAERHNAYEIRSKAERIASRSSAAKERIARLKAKQLKNWNALSPAEQKATRENAYKF